ncbi:hypothetical protein BGZ63DRAFT_416929 [Mariannaea sp. PMI_226]|nr:hypothetical protein BGZ63DRAFT_416929 [Mariannaea sp. PMI_226]
MTLLNRGPAHAKAQVEDIRTEFGEIKQQIWNTFIPEAKQAVKQAFKRKDALIASTTSILAKNLYTSNARFVFELLQNAEDNAFEHTKQQGQVPFVDFRVYHNRIVIDCNEDGFTEANLKAICDVGQSSKTQAEGYIGEKGIGFKSVFMAARKVHIQSNDLSISFCHDIEDEGLGMIIPIWEDATEELPRPLTRMTLHLHDQGDQETLSLQRETIRKQFHDLQETLLLFLNNLKEIRITFFDGIGEVESSTILSSATIDGCRVNLTKRESKQGKELTTSKIFYMVRHRVENLARNENRKYSEESERTKLYATTDVRLGFPLSAESEPVIEPQDVFTFLPMRHEGFSFLIQGDFVTEANRQSIVTTSRRNQGIRDGIAEAFIQAVLEFCKHPKLQYAWPQYLPNASGHNYDSFWRQLITLITEKIVTVPILRPWSGEGLRRMKELRYLQPCHLDGDGNPLLVSENPEIYLSAKYTPKDIGILESYGLTRLQHEDIVSLVEKDLSGTNSRIQSGKSTDDWHNRVATLLLQVLDTNGLPSLQQKLRDLPLIELPARRWVNANVSGGVYFHKCKGLRIPNHLDINLVLFDGDEDEPSQRSLLMTRLGVSTASVDFVYDKIFWRHASSGKSNVIQWIEEMRFLYSANFQITDDTLIWSLKSVDSDKHLNYRFSGIYFRDDDEFGTYQVLGTDCSRDCASNGLNIRFIHPYYIKYAPKKSNHIETSWEDWLCTTLGLSRLVRLVNSKKNLGITGRLIGSETPPTDLSEAVYHVAEYHSTKFLGFLRHHWPEGGKKIEDSSELRKKLWDIQVPCQGGQSLPLKNTYLPLANLLDQYNRFMRSGEHFPFLVLPTSTPSGNLVQTWGFLTKFNVDISDNIRFYLWILYYICSHEPKTVQDDKRIVDLYCTLYGKFAQSTSQFDDRRSILQMFENSLKIYVPPKKNEEECTWVSMQNCLWNGPSYFITKSPLKLAYDGYIQNNQVAESSVQWLFCNVLKLPNVTWNNIIEELEYRAKHGVSRLEETQDLYQILHGMVTTDKINKTDVKKLRAVFNEKSLILRPSESDSSEFGWHRVSGCLWSSVTEIRGRAVLEHHYESLKSFFVDVLGVQTLSLQLVYEELKLLGGSTSASVKQVEEKIFVFNSFLKDSDDYGKLDPKELRRKKIFPVKHPNGEVELCTAEINFAIVDRTHLGEYFGARIKTLNFGFGQLRSLEAFLHWVGLQDRFISGMVRERSHVDESGMRLVPIKDCRIRSKAHAICSPRLERTSIEDLYATIRNAQVYETDKISSELSISQDGKPINHTLNTSELHIRVQDTVLEIFVSSNKKRQEICYASKLPSQLLTWLMSDEVTHIPGEMNEKAKRVLVSVLTSSRDTATSVLQDEGIALINIQDEESEAEESSAPEYEEVQVIEPAAHEDSDEEQPLTAYTPGRDRRSLSTTQVTTPNGVAHTPLLQPSDVEEVGSVSLTSHLRASHPRPVVVAHLPGDYESRRIWSSTRVDAQVEITAEDIDRYRQLIDQVIVAARAANFPSRPNNPMDMSALLDALPTDAEEVFSYSGSEEIFRFRSRSQLERDKMVGAAGELFVFELLKALDPVLPNFSIDNWQSTIRSYVKTHAEYGNMAPWSGGREVADLMYDDTAGALTELFIDQGYLDESWRNCRPSYLLEVKTTTSSCNTPFYMSKAQYKRMRDSRDSRDTVYVVFRVFNLRRDSIGLRVYVNPAEMQDGGELVFTGETWSIVPGNRAE